MAANRRTRNTAKPIGEINLTPLMDLTFILLITFIITFPLIEQGVPVNLPTGEGNPLDPEEAMSISLDKAGELFVNDRPVTHAELINELKIVKQTRPDVSVMVRADESIAYGKVVEVMQALHKTKISNMALVTQSGKEVGSP